MPTLTKGSRSVSVRQPAIVRETLLDLFGPKRSLPGILQSDAPEGQKRLWADDALHRSRNLAQMSLSLGAPRLRHLHVGASDSYEADARALSRAYAELAATENIGLTVACETLLEAIATKLVALFSGERSIQLHLEIDRVVLLAEQRRALILIASELVINALKYAFLTNDGGCLLVSLRRSSASIELTVADDGVGLLPQQPTGSGSMLILGLAALLPAKVRYTNNQPGLHVLVSVGERI